MKFSPFLLAALVPILSGCATDVIVVQPSWQKEPIKIVGCKSVVQYSGHSFSFQGVEIPVPQLGGNAKVGQFTYQPQTLNTLYRNVAILDALRLQYCGDRVAAAQSSRAAYEACNLRIQQQEDKIAELAMAATQGEAAVEDAVHKYSSAARTAAAPTNSAVKAADKTAAAEVKKNAVTSAKPTPAPKTTANPVKTTAAPTPTPSPLPAQVAAVIKTVSKETILKIARQPAPSPKPQ